MKEVQLIRKSELSEGGCNACGVVEATSYTLKLGANKAIISERSEEHTSELQSQR